MNKQGKWKQQHEGKQLDEISNTNKFCTKSVENRKPMKRRSPTNN